MHRLYDIRSLASPTSANTAGKNPDAERTFNGRTDPSGGRTVAGGMKANSGLHKMKKSTLCMAAIKINWRFIIPLNVCY